MKKLIFLLMLLPALCWGQYQLIPLRADTCISTTADTSARIDMYNGTAGGPRLVRPTVHFNITEIGTNTTHYWIQVDFYINEDAAATDAAGWAPIHTAYWYDWEGYVDSDQNSFALACPWMDNYNFRYFYMVYHCPYGVAGDSTIIQCEVSGDKGQNAPTINPTYVKMIPHDKIWNTSAAKVINGGVTLSSTVLDFRIETTPGIYQIPDRGWISVHGDAVKVESDTLTVKVQGVMPNGSYSVNFLDTLSIPIGSSGSGQSPFSMTLSGGTGFVSFCRVQASDEGAADTTGFYMDIYLECDP